nr:PREDICTED: uncharacterized protein LOC108205662 [Daucus carota subsp. sativus]
MQGESLFTCDACYEEAKDASYVCTTCDFWIHKKCAFSPPIIPVPTYHHHPLNPIFSIPDMHRNFPRACNICSGTVFTSYWMYHNHRCCAYEMCYILKFPIVNEIEENDADNDPDLVQVPLPNENSLFQLIIVQCGILQLNYQSEPKSTLTKSRIPDEPRITEEHWSHYNQSLEELRFTVSENDNDDNDDAMQWAHSNHETCSSFQIRILCVLFSE